MTTSFRLILILLMVLTGQSLAAARGQAQIAGEVVLCAGEITRVVSVDAQGQPVQRVSICPDMALSLLNGFAVPMGLGAPDPAAIALEPVAPQPVHHGIDRPASRARDPPLSLFV